MDVYYYSCQKRKKKIILLIKVFYANAYLVGLCKLRSKFSFFTPLLQLTSKPYVILTLHVSQFSFFDHRFAGFGISSLRLSPALEQVNSAFRFAAARTSGPGSSAGVPPLQRKDPSGGSRSSLRRPDAVSMAVLTDNIFSLTRVTRPNSLYLFLDFQC